MRFSIGFAWRLLRAQWQAGDVRVLCMALVLAVTALTSVVFFTDRIAQQLAQQGASLLGADAVLVSDHPIAATHVALRSLNGLRSAMTMEFTSMAIHGERNQLAEIKALDGHFPLIGAFDVQTAMDTQISLTHGPRPGEVWLEPRLARALKIALGDQLELGAMHFTVTAWLVREPSRGGSLFTLAPRVMMHIQDVPATQLVQFGSRVKYGLAVAGPSSQVLRWQQQLTPQLALGEKMETVNDARPEIRSALDKSTIFLSLSALVTVMLSVVAMALSSTPFIARCQETAVLLRVFGASSAVIQRILLSQALMLASVGAIFGCALGYVLQFGLAAIAGHLFVDQLPAPSMRPIGLGGLLSVSIVLSLLWPPLSAISRRSPMQRLRSGNTGVSWQRALQALPLLVVIALFVLGLAKSWSLAVGFILAIIGLGIGAGAGGIGLATLLHQLSDRMALPMAIRLGMRNVKRRLKLSMIQIIGFSLGAMVLLLITMVKTDLMHAWQQSLPLDAPNLFVINIQPEQVKSVQAWLTTQPISPQPPTLYAMVRGRLLEKNGIPVQTLGITEERAKRLLEREFNLSPAAHMQVDNQLVQGRWWRPAEANAPLLSLEEGIAHRLQIRVGDRLTFDVAGQRLTLTVANLRQVKWDNLKPNFFAVTPPETMTGYPASYLTAFYLPAQHAVQSQRLVQTFPNVSVIDVGSVLKQLNDILAKLTLAIRFVFGFCVVAGVVVLSAALFATRQARLEEASLLRALGASRQQVSTLLLTEYAVIALVSALVAVLIANALGAYVSTQLLALPFQVNWGLSLTVFVMALTAIPAVAWLVMREALNRPPKQLLHSL